VRYAILSDIHGNLEALRAVLADCADEVDGVLCLGDTVGYGADPLACVDLVAERAEASVAGNHEYAVGGRLRMTWFNHYARAAAEWTQERLDDDHRAYLIALPVTREIAGATLVHASPSEPEQWDYLVTAEDGLAAFGASSGPEHRPGAGLVQAERGRRYLVNVGSVGQPRDRDARAAYAVWDVEAGRLQIRRVDYDVATARRKIVEAGLPRFLADRLAVGS
jgi:diadenosine tetraphosphatase ApaH/serine/threonine PP2A family protein phosphatase